MSTALYPAECALASCTASDVFPAILHDWCGEPDGGLATFIPGQSLFRPAVEVLFA